MTEITGLSLLEKAKIMIKQPWRIVSEPKNAKFDQLKKYGTNAFTFEGKDPDKGKLIHAKVIGVAAIPVQEGLSSYHGAVRFDVQIEEDGQIVACIMKPYGEWGRTYPSFKAFTEGHGENQTRAFFSEYMLQRMVQEEMITPERKARNKEFHGRMSDYSKRK